MPGGCYRTHVAKTVHCAVVATRNLRVTQSPVDDTRRRTGSPYVVGEGASLRSQECHRRVSRKAVENSYGLGPDVNQQSDEVPFLPFANFVGDAEAHWEDQCNDVRVKTDELGIVRGGCLVYKIIIIIMAPRASLPAQQSV